MALTIWRQIGDAPDTPEATCFIAVLSLFPTHTPTISSWLQPIAQLSFLSLVVPVLTAIGLPVLSKELAPNAIVRAELSVKILSIKNASSGDITRSPSTCL